MSQPQLTATHRQMVRVPPLQPGTRAAAEKPWAAACIRSVLVQSTPMKPRRTDV